MASSSVNPFKSAVAQVAFTLATASETGAKFMVAGRALACPFVVEVKRKVNPNSTANDHIQLRVARTEQNAVSNKPATCQMLLDMSIPKDVSVLNAQAQQELATIMMSLLRDNTLAASTANQIVSLIEGRDL